MCIQLEVYRSMCENCGEKLGKRSGIRCVPKETRGEKERESDAVGKT